MLDLDLCESENAMVHHREMNSDNFLETRTKPAGVQRMALAVR